MIDETVIIVTVPDPCATLIRVASNPLSSRKGIPKSRAKSPSVVPTSALTSMPPNEPPAAVIRMIKPPLANAVSTGLASSLKL